MGDDSREGLGEEAADRTGVVEARLRGPGDADGVCCELLVPAESWSVVE